jgi:hypothetical protein
MRWQDTMARCSECNRFKNVEFNGDVNQTSLDIDGYGLISAEYEFTLGCEDCGTDMLTGIIVIEREDATQGVQDFIDTEHTDEEIEAAREKARMEFLSTVHIVTEEDLTAEQMEQMQFAMEEAEGDLDDHDFQIEETSVDVYGDTECKKAIWVLEVVAKITDAKHPEWEGEEITLKDSIRQSEMEEC